MLWSNSDLSSVRNDSLEDAVTTVRMRYGSSAANGHNYGRQEMPFPFTKIYYGGVLICFLTVTARLRLLCANDMFNGACKKGTGGSFESFRCSYTEVFWATQLNTFSECTGFTLFGSLFIGSKFRSGENDNWTRWKNQHLNFPVLSGELRSLVV